MIRVRLPAQLQVLAHADAETMLEIAEPVTLPAVLDALEACYPILRGTIRDRESARRRPFVRFFACERDLSHDAPEAPLPDEVARGIEPLLIVGAMAGG